jgi:fructose-1,6-bisphosphatase/inositol monophosphatase family enzyme
MRRETETAIRAARLAQEIADSRAGADQITSKGGIDLVTAADIACEDRIREELLRVFPDYPVIGEERGGEPVAGQPYWLVDPICGTCHFASNIPLYCHNIALVENGEVTVAAIGVGKSEEILFAEKGAGGWIRTANGERKLSVSDRSNAIWLDGGPRVAEVSRHAILSNRWYVWMYSTTLSLAHLADGRLAGILHLGAARVPRAGSVHFAAGCLVASEAGAIVMDLETRRPWDLLTRSYLLAATREVQEELMKLVDNASAWI